MTNRDSFSKVENWLNELETYSTNHDIVKMLVGNKVGIYLFIHSFVGKLLYVLFSK